MHGHSASKHSLFREESLNLLDEKAFSDSESEGTRADLEDRFPKQPWTTIVKTYAGRLGNGSCKGSIPRAVLFILPSFVQSRLTVDRSSRTERIGPTAYLDGMRGLAAFVVFFCHYFYTSFWIAESWGWQNGNRYFLKLPIIRLFYQGPPMVCIFYVISGYALSYKPVKLIRSRSFEQLSNTLASFTFRRAFRLYLPTIISTLMIVVMLRMGLYEWTRDFANDSKYMRNVKEMAPNRLGSTEEQLKEWGRHMFNFLHVWGWEPYGGSTYYDPHLWTIPVEFRCSLVLFLMQIATARLRTWARFCFIIAVTYFSYLNYKWELVLFLVGMMLAELDLIRGAHTPPPAGSPDSPILLPYTKLEVPTQHRRKAKEGIWIIISVVALYLMSQPDHGGEDTPGWVYLSTFVPEWYGEKYRYWQSIGASIFVLCAGHSPRWQSFFNTAVVQYLGKISYAIYLMHGPVMHTVGYAIERWAYRITGAETWGQYHAGFVLASFFIIPAVVWAADVFWRAVDAPVVKFAKWFEGKVSIRD